MMKTALIIGATGLVGSALLEQLLENPAYDSVVVLHRRKTGIQHVKLVEHLVNFDALSEDSDYFQGDVLFSALGTTIKSAGSQNAQYKIDFTYQLEAAKLAKQNGVGEYVLVSSAGANSTSHNFYTRMKGELEDEIKKLNFEKTRFIQPSLLDGPRKEFRLGEKIGLVLMKVIGWIPFIRQYKPIHAVTVAKAMQNSLLSNEQIQTIALLDLFDLADD